MRRGKAREDAEKGLNGIHEKGDRTMRSLSFSAVCISTRSGLKAAIGALTQRSQRIAKDAKESKNKRGMIRAPLFDQAC